LRFLRNFRLTILCKPPDFTHCTMFHQCAQYQSETGIEPRLLLLLVFALFFPFFLSAAEPMIHVIIADDGRAGFGANLVADYKNMERLFKENVPASRLELIVMDMDEITPDNILQTVQQTKLSAEDTLVFYYPGHAANDAGNGEHYFQLKDRSGNNVELQRRTLLAEMKKKQPRLTVLLTDCCNIELKGNRQGSSIDRVVTGQADTGFSSSVCRSRRHNLLEERGSFVCRFLREETRFVFHLSFRCSVGKIQE